MNVHNMLADSTRQYYRTVNIIKSAFKHLVQNQMNKKCATKRLRQKGKKSLSGELNPHPLDYEKHVPPQVHLAFCFILMVLITTVDKYWQCLANTNRYRSPQYRHRLYKLQEMSNKTNQTHTVCVFTVYNNFESTKR